jgi:hypothetical protein
MEAGDWRKDKSGVLAPLQTDRRVRFHVLTLASMKMTAFLMMAVSTTTLSVNFYESTWHNISDGCHLQIAKRKQQQKSRVFLSMKQEN